ncbi:hypothetical protein FXO37_33630 [Capsicum annuum]|nr:hypothetical protein FXO37_33630 [Capsicum annuum]
MITRHHHNEQHLPARVLTLKVYPPIISAFPPDKGSPDISLYLDEWSTKEEIDVLDLNQLLSIKRECIKEYKERFPKSQEKIITFEGELYAIGEKRPLSEDKVEKLSKLKEEVENYLSSITETETETETKIVGGTWPMTEIGYKGPLISIPTPNYIHHVKREWDDYFMKVQRIMAYLPLETLDPLKNADLAEIVREN